MFEQAEALLPRDLPSKVGAQVLSSFARALARVDQISRAGELAQRALEAAEAVNATEPKLETQNVLALAGSSNGRPPRVIRAAVPRPHAGRRG